MSENPEDAKLGPEELDLSSLLDTDFGPAWSIGSTSPNQLRGSQQKAKDERRSSKGKRSGSDGKHSPRRQGERPDRRQGKKSGSTTPRRGPPSKEERPFHEISFYPTPETFKALAGNLRETGRTYELFALAGIILAKPERFLVRANLPKDAAAKGKALCVSKTDGLVFDSAEEVIAHLITKHPEQLYKVEEEEVEPPSGNFPAINRCGMTRAWLGPPNYHRYAEIIREHHTTNLGDVPFGRFEAKIETIREPEAATAWLEEMRTARKYVLKVHKGDVSETFDSLEALRKHLALHKASELVRSSVKAEFPGRLLDDLPAGRLKDDIWQTLERQRRFPLETALALQGRFRTAKFHQFKRGKKGIAFVSHVKRRRRLPGETFSPSIEALLTFVESNPLVEKGSLAEKHLGITAENRESTESSEAIRCLARDLHWLVGEGYVTEYSDGRLETRPPLAASERTAKKKETKEKEGGETVIEAEPETPTAEPGGDASIESAVLEKNPSPDEASPQL